MAKQGHFAGKVAIVTGGASGIGRALAVELATRNARVVIADIDEPRALETAAHAARLGGEVEVERLDVTDAGAVEALVARVADEHGRLDLMFNNAGIAVVGEALEMELADWERVVDVNIRGVVHGVRAAYALMVRQRSGHIVNTASMAGLAPCPGFAIYAASKHAVVGLSTSLRIEAARHGVRVSVACPGLIETALKQNAKFVGLDRKVVDSVRYYPAVDCARDILSGVEKNQAVIVVTRLAKIFDAAYRLAPGLTEKLVAHQMKRTLRNI